MSAKQSEDPEDDEEEQAKEFERQEALKKQRRQEQMEKIQAAIPPLTERVTELRLQHQRLVLLQSVSEGLYEELDKLAKKAPADEVTDLALVHVNDVIRETKELVSNDPYVQKYTEFVAAGDNPQYRDVVIVLRQIRQGMDRFSGAVAGETKRMSQLLADCRGIKVALAIYLKDEDHADRSDIRYNNEDAGAEWFDSSERFLFNKLDRINIPVYFGAAR